MSIFPNKNRKFIVEIRNVPEVFSKIKAIGFKDAKENNFMPGDISDAGITSLINNITNPDLDTFS